MKFKQMNKFKAILWKNYSKKLHFTNFPATFTTQS